MHKYDNVPYFYYFVIWI